jgi:hypothetical protein
MIRDNSPCRLQWNTHEASVDNALGFSGSRTRLQWSFSGGVGLWVGVLCSSPSQNSGSHLPEILGIRGFLHHQTASFAGAPITPRERCHVTQPRARINVSCSRSRADHKGGTGATTRAGSRASEGWEAWVPNQGTTPGTGQGGTGTA